MALEHVEIPAINKFSSMYLQQREPVTSFFHYNIKNMDVFSKRLDDLKQREFPRTELVACIREYMEGLPHSEETLQSLKKLEENGVVVIGGQQAGLLTGPLYTIHKVISIIKLAKEQEKKLLHPVVPVFWIAGEDHDFQEINHIFIEKNDALEKIGYPERVVEKKAASKIEFTKDIMTNWVTDIFKELGETPHTDSIYTLITTAISHSESIVDFFAYIIMELFKEQGLVVIDSGFDRLRKIEQPFMKHLIEHTDTITSNVLAQQKEIQDHNFSNVIELSRSAANLFIEIEGDRVLLEKHGDLFVDKNRTISFTIEELLQILHKTPERFSNNVVTRPLMQEWLFPSLAFIGGPGEIAYWGELKRVFDWVGFSMPPVVPRLNITILERDVSKYIEELELNIKTVLTEGIQHVREAYWNSFQDQELHRLIHQAKENLFKNYEEITEKVVSLDKGMQPIIEKNLHFHQQQFDYIVRKTDQSIKEKHRVLFRKLSLIENALRPNSGPQERTMNLMYFLNRYGIEFIDRLMSEQYEFDGTHKLYRI